MKKFLWMTALLATLAVFFAGCPQPGPGPEPESDPITWDIAQIGGVAGATDDIAPTATTTHIRITFSAAPSGTWQNRVKVGGVVTNFGAFSKVSDTVYDIPILEMASSGDAQITINTNTFNITAGTKSVKVYLLGSLVPIGYEAVANGTSGVTTSTQLTFTFEKDVSGLTDADIALTNGTGNAEKGALTPTADPKIWNLGIIVQTQGNITVKITKNGIDVGTKTVAVYKNASEGIQVPDTGEDASFKWYRLVVDSTGEQNPAAGTGKIKDNDFALIIEAAGWQESYLRVYYDDTNKESDTANGWGIGAVGNLGNLIGSSNWLFNYNSSEVFAQIPVVDFLDYFKESDAYLYVNIWRGFKILGVLVYIPKNGTAVEILPEGYTNISLPSVDGTKGKGTYGGPALAAINGAGAGAYLEIEVNKTGAADAWGAYIKDSNWTSGTEIKTLLNSGSTNPFTITIELADIFTEYGVSAGELTLFGFNISGCSFNKITLVDPSAMDPDADATYNISADGTSGTISSTKININFNKPVTGLVKDNITVTNVTGDVGVGDLSGSGKAWALAITVNTAGTVTLAISKSGIESTTKGPVTVYKSEAVVVPESGSDADWTWTKLQDWDYTGDGKDESVGKGSIVGDDCEAIIEATQWKNTYIRVYYEYLPDAEQWPGGRVGGGSWSADTASIYKDVTLKAAREGSEGIQDGDTSVFFNVWGGVKIVGALLYVPNVKEAEVEPITLYDGATWKSELGTISATSASGSITGGVIKWFPGSWAQDDDRRLVVSFAESVDASGYTMLVLEFEGTYNMGGYCGFGFGEYWDYSGNAKSIGNVSDGKFTVSCDLTDSTFSSVDFAVFGGFGLTANNADKTVATNGITLISVALK